jgi:hypothetical protein
MVPVTPWIGGGGCGWADAARELSGTAKSRVRMPTLIVDGMLHMGTPFPGSSSK